MVNRLTAERSPYLRQHQDNPVDWYPWGHEALAAAQRENKPIMLSIGYAACHWCHVMAHESFEDRDTARLMNEHFINIKVDREERPDVDALYMEAVQALTGSGGWPLNVFLTPDLRPFYGGTYFPPAPRHGMPSWRDVLVGASDAFRDRPDDVEHNAAALLEYLERSQRLTVTSAQPGRSELDSAYGAMRSQIEPEHGGFGGAPKFPQPLALEFLLAEAVQRADADAITFVRDTLIAMARGGIYDQLGGGFHRYSVDAHWLVPHFEKMLYDNALLARVYLHAYQVTRISLFRQIAEETLDYIVRDLRSPDGSFFSSEDADSDGVEGSFYLWNPADMDAALERHQISMARQWFAITDAGNFEGQTILTTPMSLPDFATARNLSSSEAETEIRAIRNSLLVARHLRVRPATDRKQLVSWNALAIGALAEVGTALNRPDFLEAAVKAAHFISNRMYHGGMLRRSYLDGTGPTSGFLEDYAYLADSMIDLYQSTFEASSLGHAHDLLQRACELFGDASTAALFDTPASTELPVRPRSLYDNPIPSGNSAFVSAALRLSALTGSEPFRDVVNAAFSTASAFFARAPLAVSHLLRAFAFDVRGATQIAVVGVNGLQRSEMVRVTRDRYLPYTVVAVGTTGPPALLDHRDAPSGAPRTYVCRRFACHLPVTTSDALTQQLDALSPGELSQT